MNDEFPEIIEKKSILSSMPDYIYKGIKYRTHEDALEKRNNDIESSKQAIEKQKQDDFRKLKVSQRYEEYSKNPYYLTINIETTAKPPEQGGLLDIFKDDPIGVNIDSNDLTLKIDNAIRDLYLDGFTDWNILY